VKSLGADAVIDYTKDDFSHAGRVYDVIVDTVGKSGFQRSMRALKRGGTYVLIAGPFLPNLGRLWASITGAARIVSPFAGATVKDFGPHIRFLKELIESGNLRTVVSRRYPFARIADAHAHAEHRTQSRKCPRSYGRLRPALGSARALDRAAIFPQFFT
jgi:NADPH:quinone reductase-like Zn-dependent oxidoreductase